MDFIRSGRCACGHSESDVFDLFQRAHARTLIVSERSVGKIAGADLLHAGNLPFIGQFSEADAANAVFS